MLASLTVPLLALQIVQPAEPTLPGGFTEPWEFRRSTDRGAHLAVADFRCLDSRLRGNVTATRARLPSSRNRTGAVRAQRKAICRRR